MSSPTKATWPAWNLPYRRDRLVLIVPAAHLLAGEPAVAFARVLGEPFVCLHAGSAIHTFMMNHAAQLGGRLDVRIQVRSFNTVCRMVAAGVGIGMALLAVAAELSSGPAIGRSPTLGAVICNSVFVRVCPGLPPHVLLEHLAGMGSGRR